MANKRQLTGGTDDVNPQYISGQIALVDGTVTEVAVGNPTFRAGGDASSSTATIMELLKIYADIPNDHLGVAADALVTSEFSVTTASTGGTPIIGVLGSPRTLAAFRKFFRNKQISAGGSDVYGLSVWDRNPVVWDFTDGAGHGVLVATDNLFLQTLSTNAIAGTVNYKILYRFKKVKLVEYIGIVQSQQ